MIYVPWMVCWSADSGKFGDSGESAYSIAVEKSAQKSAQKSVEKSAEKLVDKSVENLT